jgi:ATP-dependent Clp protease ATP-binding subunit ClpC
MEKQAVSRIIGSPPGYVGYEEGGQLTEKVRRRPYCVVLFDEVEKAHEDAMNILLQIMEEGRATDGMGRTVSFKNAVILMTSNVGSTALKQGGGIGFNSNRQQAEAIKHKIKESVESNFRPEFRNSNRAEPGSPYQRRDNFRECLRRVARIGVHEQRRIRIESIFEEQEKGS